MISNKRDFLAGLMFAGTGAVAMAIAVVKATVVILWFMHVIHSPRLTWIVVISSFLWLGVLFVLTFSDYLTRHWNIY